MKYTSWCNDKPLKLILTEFLISNQWIVISRKAELKITEQALNTTQNYLRDKKYILNPKLSSFQRNNTYLDLQTILFHTSISPKIKPDLIAFRGDSILLLENKSRLFNKIRNEILSKPEAKYYDHYFLKYHFDDPPNAINAFLDLIVFKENMLKSIQGRISETIHNVTESCELFRYCAVFNDPLNIKQNFSFPLHSTETVPPSFKHFYVILTIPFYVDQDQRHSVIKSIQNLQIFCDNVFSIKVHIDIWEILPGKFQQTNESQGSDPTEFNITNLLPCGGEIQVLFKEIPFSSKISIKEYQETHRLITERTGWRTCSNCTYFKKYCSVVLK